MNKETLKKFVKEKKYHILLVTILSFLITIEVYHWFNSYWMYYTANDLSIIAHFFFSVLKNPHLLLDIVDRSLLFKKHLSLSFFGFIPLYTLYTNFKFFHFIKIFSLLFTAFPIFLLAKEKLASEKKAFILSLSFLICPLVLIFRFMRFHISFLAIPLLVFSLFLYEKDKLKPFLITMTFTIFLKENIAPIFLFLGLYSLRDKKSKKWFFYIFLIAIINIGMYFGAYSTYISGASGEDPFTNNYGVSLGNFSIEFFKGALARKTPYVHFVNLFSKVGFFVLLSPEIFFLSIPKILEVLLHRNVLLRPGMDEDILLIPLIYVGSVYSIANLQSFFNERLKRNKAEILSFIVISFFVMNMLHISLTTDNSYLLRNEKFPSMNICEYSFKHSIKDKIGSIQSMENKVPENASYSSDSSIRVLFSSDFNYYPPMRGVFPKRPPDYLIVNKELYTSYYGGGECDSLSHNLRDYKYQYYMNKTNYAVLEEERGIKLLKRIDKPEGQFIIPEDS